MSPAPSSLPLLGPDPLLAAVTLAALASAGLLSGAEAATAALTPRRLEDLIQRSGGRLAPLGDRPRLLTTLLVTRSLLLLALGSLGTIWALSSGARAEALLGAAALSSVGVMTVEILARLLALGRLERAFTLTAPGLILLSRLMAPLTATLFFLLRPISGLRGGLLLSPQLVTEEDVKTLIDQGKAQGLIEREEAEMLRSVIEFQETIAREVMVPRVDIAAVPQEARITEAVDLMIEKGFSRLPVYQDHIDHIVGLVHGKDLLFAVRRGELERPLRELLRPARFIPGSKAVDEILRELQQEKISMAIVADEYGGTEGLLTVEDLLEEIVGEIHDEHDPEQATTVDLPDGSTLVDARMILEDVNERVGISLPVEDHETLGGFVYGTIGRVPTPGEAIESDGVRLTVAGVQRQRITRVRIERLSPPEEAASAPGP